MRTADERIANVRRLLAAARAVYAQRDALAGEIAGSSGLSREGVAFGFEHLERDASDADLGALVRGAGDAARIHVILSSNVFVAPLRAIAIARAASERVTVRCSPREPALARALVEAARDPAIAIVEERDVATIDADEIHVYGRDETIEGVRSRARPGTIVRAHGTGMGGAFLSRSADLDAAGDELARDVVAFDQRGCLSPRIALVEGDRDRAEHFCASLHTRLAQWQTRIPRGGTGEGGAAWREALAFAGRIWATDDHAVALAPESAPLAIPPALRYVLVVRVSSPDEARSLLAPIARHVVAVGCDEPSRAGAFVPPHARVSALGAMQRPPLDGPVDRRAGAERT